MISGTLKGALENKGSLSGSLTNKRDLGGSLTIPRQVEVFLRDYELLDNKPQIENVTLIGNKTFSELGISSLANTEIEMILNS